MLPPRLDPVRLPRSRAGSIASSNKPSSLNTIASSDSNKLSPLIKSPLKTDSPAPATPTKSENIKDAEGIERPDESHKIEAVNTSNKSAKRDFRSSVILTLNRTKTAGGTQWEGLYNELDGKYLSDIQQKVPKEDVPMEDHLAGLLHEEEVKYAYEAEEESNHVQVTEENEKEEEIKHEEEVVKAEKQIALSDKNKKPETVEDVTEMKDDSPDKYEKARKQLLENPPKEPLLSPLTPEQLSYHAKMMETVRQKLEEIPIPFSGFPPSDENKSIDDGLTLEEQKVKENFPVGENKLKENNRNEDGRPRAVGL